MKAAMVCPTNIPRHSGVLGTLPLTEASVATVPPSLSQFTGPGARVHGDGLADDEAIAHELADGLAGVGIGDLVDLIGIEPDLALATANDGGSETLLGAKVDPVVAWKKCVLVVCVLPYFARS